MKEKIDTLILSDIHLGSKFCRAGKVLEILDKHNFKRLILNGDIFDGLNFNRLHTEHWGVLSKIRKLSLAGEVVWINGNHDGDAAFLSRLIGVRVYKNYSWEINGKKAIAIHGHQFDRFLHKNMILSGIAIFIYYAIARFDGKRDLFANWLRKRSGSWLRLSREVARGAILYARVRNAQYIFCGHTHNSMQKESGKIRYYNSGSWTEKPSSYIIVNKEGVKIIKVN